MRCVKEFDRREKREESREREERREAQEKEESLGQTSPAETKMKPRGSPNHPRRWFGRPRVPQTASGMVLGGFWGSPGALLGSSWGPFGVLGEVIWSV